ncbi:hypothetical protein CSKR_106237 [Clonorchis sinensis]|uniref:Uncharacterized protein n=1 Tax=Clonorchis sinensis TaxID=79923 RepID=A0A3R7FEJ2_CLOSI|nr:hypothetical protein CSKR_106237 [Clonorchis sinensis]
MGICTPDLLNRFPDDAKIVQQMRACFDRTDNAMRQLMVQEMLLWFGQIRSGLPVHLAARMIRVHVDRHHSRHADAQLWWRNHKQDRSYPPKRNASSCDESKLATADDEILVWKHACKVQEPKKGQTMLNALQGAVSASAVKTRTSGTKCPSYWVWCEIQ